MSDVFETYVRIDRVHLTFFGHATVDGLHVHDQKGRLLFNVTRTGVELSIRKLLFDGELVFNSAQIYGATAHVSQSHPDSTLNLQFIIDRLASKDSTRKPLPHIEVRSIMVRHTDITFDRLWKGHRQGFDPNHINLQDMAVTGMLHELNSDTVNVELRRLSFREKSGLTIKNVSGHLNNGRSTGINLHQIEVVLGDESHLSITEASYFREHFQAQMTGSIRPEALSMFYAPLSKIDKPLSLQLDVQGTKQEIEIRELSVMDEEKTVSLLADGTLKPDTKQIPDFNLNISNLALGSGAETFILPFINQSLPILSQLDGTVLRGQFLHLDGEYKGNLDLSSPLGDIEASGSMKNGYIKAQTDIRDLKLGSIISLGRDSSQTIGALTASAKIAGHLKSAKGMPEGKLTAHIDEMTYKGYTYQRIRADITHEGTLTTAEAALADSAANAYVNCRINTSDHQPYIQGLIDINNLDLRTTHLTAKGPVDRLKLKIGMDLAGNTFDNMEGNISIPHIIIERDSTTYTFTNLQLLSHPDGPIRHVRVISPYANAQVDGMFQPQDLLCYLQEVGHEMLPDVIDTPRQKSSDAYVNLALQVNDVVTLRNLLHLDLGLDDGPLMAEASINTPLRQIYASVNAPCIRYGKQSIRDIRLNLSNTAEGMLTSVHAQPQVKGMPIDLDFNASLGGHQLNTTFSWKAKHAQRNDGNLHFTGTVEHIEGKGLGLYANVHETQFYINDTLWTIHPSQLYYRSKELYVENFRLSMSNGERSLAIRGTASDNWSDSLTVDLNEIDLGYILTLAKLRPVELGGLVTGRIVGRNMFRNPIAQGHVRMPMFYLNQAPLGALDADLSWNVIPGSLGLKGLLTDEQEDSRIEVNGDIHLLRDPIDYLDLDVHCRKANAAFMQRYVADLMDDFEGRVSGHVHIFGPMRMVDMEAEAFVNQLALTVPALNTRYYTYGDSLTIRPGVIQINNVRAYDRHGMPSRPAEHSALVNGSLTHDHFSDLRFNLGIEAQNILAYDTHTFDDGAFYATCYGTGNVHLQGAPGYVNIDVDVTPLRGTTLTYNATNPDALTEAGFLTFNSRSQLLAKENQNEIPKTATPAPATDLRIKFNVKLTPDVQLRLLMDPRTGDYITLYGRGQMGASFYNKGDFQLYGTCHVDHGTYKLTLQDVIHKDFQLRKDGTITFNGPPMEADLNVQAMLPVPSVSLNDLSARGTFSNDNVRVNCLMNITGKAAAPAVAFDFELPSVNEEEARMVRSLISTEEERNLQVIYLLGIGRFYTYDYSASQNQSSTAMNSLLSSTLSGQINQVMRNIIGSADWNFGTHISTGQMGWREMDVEGMLSGRMLNNRLLINGNFGYRDNPVAKNNFVGDFDVQYLLSKNGNLILKAYSETNDRYFTKSSLTTQGVGIMAKRDFSDWNDFIHFITLQQRRQKKTQKQTSATEGSTSEEKREQKTADNR